MKNTPNILVVCGRNKRRGKAAEALYRRERAFNMQSAGLSPKSPSQINETKISWSDAIFVMEDEQIKSLKSILSFNN